MSDLLIHCQFESLACVSFFRIATASSYVSSVFVLIAISDLIASSVKKPIFPLESVTIAIKGKVV